MKEIHVTDAVQSVESEYPMDYRQIFAERLNKARKKKRISKVDFSLQATVAVNKVKSTLSPHDPTHGSLTVESLYATAKLLGVTTDYLLGLSDSPE